MQQRPDPAVENSAALENTFRQRRRIQMALPRESLMTQPSIAAAMGVPLSTVNRAHMASPLLDGFPREARKGKPESGEAYDQGGLRALKPRPSGGRKRENMSLRELLTRFPRPLEPAKC